MKRGVWFCLALLFCATLPSISGQLPTNNEWEFGWDTEVEPSYTLALDGEKWKIQDTLVFFVDNPRINDLSLNIVVEFDEDTEFLDASFEESITVSAQSNETFSIDLSTSNPDDVRGHSPSDNIAIVVTAEESAAGAPVSPKEIDADLNVPRFHKLLPEVTLLASKVDAGTWIEESLLLNNMGNSVDAATKIEADVRNCPLLEIEGLEAGEDTQIQPTNVDGNEPLEIVFRIAPSSAHSTSTCEVTIVVTSEGNGLERSTTFSIDVRDASSTTNSNTGDSGSSSSNSASDSDTSSALPTLGVESMLGLLGIVALLRRNRLDVD